MGESDTFIKARIDSLMHLFELSNSDDVGTMILNALDTYRKMLIRDTGFQIKLSCATIEKLQMNYMIILCHRKQYEHLNSLVC